MPYPTSLHLLPASREDIPGFTEIYLTSFTDALSHACFPRTLAAVGTWWTSMNADEFDDPAARYLKVVDADANGRVAAYGKWNVPTQAGDGGDDPDALPTWPAGGDAELAQEFFGELARRRRQFMGAQPHCYLEIVATRPAQQRRGAAAQVLRWGCEYADARGLECYLEAGPDLVGLYGKFGFKVVGTYAPSRMPAHTESFMVRKPRYAAD